MVRKFIVKFNYNLKVKTSKPVTLIERSNLSDKSICMITEFEKNTIIIITF